MFHNRVISQCQLQEKLEKLDLQSFGKVAQLLITKLCNRRVTPRELIQCYPIVVLWMEQMQVSDRQCTQDFLPDSWGSRAPERGRPRRISHTTGWLRPLASSHRDNWSVQQQQHMLKSHMKGNPNSTSYFLHTIILHLLEILIFGYFPALWLL